MHIAAMPGCRKWPGVLAMLAVALTVRAATFDELAQQGEEAMKNNNLKRAIECFEKIVTEGKSYEHVMSIKFDLAWAYYLAERYKEASPLFEELSGNRAPDEDMKQQALLFWAESTGRHAAGLDGGEREKLLKKAVELHTRFQKDFPKNPNIPESYYGRAYAYHLLGDQDNAAKDLLTEIQQYPNAITVKDAQYLLASVYARMGKNKIKAGDRPGAQKHLDDARKLFAELAKGEVNLAIANDAAFSMAETWYSVELYPEAIRYYREVRSRDDVLKSLRREKEKIQVQLSRAAAQGAAGNLDVKPFKKQLDRIDAQLGRVRETTDLMISGYFRIAECFYHARMLEETRLVCRHLANFTKGEQQQQALYFLISMYIEEKRPADAQRELEAFQALFGRQIPIAKDAALYIGKLYTEQNQFALALDLFSQSIDDFPDNPRVEDAWYMKLSSAYTLTRYDDVSETADLYLKKLPKGKYAANARYLKAMAAAMTGNWDEGLSVIGALIKDFPKGTEEFKDIEGAWYQNIWMLNQKLSALIANQAPPIDKAVSAFGVNAAKLLQDKKIRATFEAPAPNNLPALKEKVDLLQRQVKDLKAKKLKVAGELADEADIITAQADALFKETDDLCGRAVELGKKFLEQHKGGKLGPQMALQTAAALTTAGKAEESRAVLQSIAKDFPDSDVAPLALYQIAIDFFRKQDYAAMAPSLENLVQAFPKHYLVSDAKYWLGFIALQNSRFDDAVKFFTESRTLSPTNQLAPECFLLTAQTLKAKADAMGLPTVLPAEKKEIYKATLLDMASIYEQLLVKHPSSGQALKAVSGMADALYPLVKYQMLSDPEAADWFAKAQGRAPDNAVLKAQLQFSYGSLLMKSNEKNKALAAFKEALKTAPNARQDYSILGDYAEALKEANALDDAEAIYGKIQADYADEVRALAPALLGLADIKFLKNDFEAAGELYNKVLNDYDWYEDGKRGRVKLAAIYENKKEYKKALEMFTAVWNTERLPAAKLGAMLGVARCQLAQAGGNKDTLKKVLDIAEKIIVLYEAYPESVAEALWLKGQALEAMGDSGKAVTDAYEPLTAKFKNYKWAKPAEERIKKLPKPVPPLAPAPAK
ncbi:MAG: tetratricopeptide repeat protein [Lentisphaerae bacterium]|nr:tetratricopeptide repeat protein [Lentisphaerota bacterium]